MKQSFKSYDELLTEVDRLQLLSDEAKLKVENRLKLDFQASGIREFIKDLNPFKGGKPSVLGLFGKKTEHKATDGTADSSLVELTIDLIYQSLGLMLIKSSKKNQLNTHESSAKTSIKLLIKSIADNLYFANKGNIVAGINALISQFKK